VLKNLPVILLRGALGEVRKESAETLIPNLLKVNEPILRLLCPGADGIK